MRCYYKWVIFLFSTCILLFFSLHPKKTHKTSQKEICAQYLNGSITGSLCPSYCNNTLFSNTFLLFNVVYARKKFYSKNDFFDAIINQINLKFPNAHIEKNVIKAIIANRLIDINFDKLLIPSEINSLWGIMQSSVFPIRLLLWNTNISPQILGLCGPYIYALKEMKYFIGKEKLSWLQNYFLSLNLINFALDFHRIFFPISITMKPLRRKNLVYDDKRHYIYIMNPGEVIAIDEEPNNLSYSNLIDLTPYYYVCQAIQDYFNIFTFDWIKNTEEMSGKFNLTQPDKMSLIQAAKELKKACKLLRDQRKGLHLTRFVRTGPSSRIWSYIDNNLTIIAQSAFNDYYATGWSMAISYGLINNKVKTGTKKIVVADEDKWFEGMDPYVVSQLKMYGVRRVDDLKPNVIHTIALYEDGKSFL